MLLVHTCVTKWRDNDMKSNKNIASCLQLNSSSIAQTKSDGFAKFCLLRTFLDSSRCAPKKNTTKARTGVAHPAGLEENFLVQQPFKTRDFSRDLAIRRTQSVCVLLVSDSSPLYRYGVLASVVGCRWLGKLCDSQEKNRLLRTSNIWCYGEPHHISERRGIQKQSSSFRGMVISITQGMSQRP